MRPRSMALLLREGGDAGEDMDDVLGDVMFLHHSLPSSMSAGSPGGGGGMQGGNRGRGRAGEGRVTAPFWFGPEDLAREGGKRPTPRTRHMRAAAAAPLPRLLSSVASRRVLMRPREAGCLPPPPSSSFVTTSV